MTLRNLFGKVLQGWHRELTDNGVPYYVSSLHASSQWYHPEYVLLLQRTIQGQRHTRYAAYRTAQKLALLQDALAVGGLSLQSLVTACAAVGLSGTDTNDDHVTLEVVEALLLALYGEDGDGGELHTPSSNSNGGKVASGQDTLLAGRKDRLENSRVAGNVKFSTLRTGDGRNNDGIVLQGRELASWGEKVESSKKKVVGSAAETIDKTVCVELLINLLLNLFDQSRQGLLPVLGVKLVLLVLCGSGAALQHKHAYLQAQLSDYSSAAPRSSVRRALLLLARLPELLGEELWFGRQLVGAALKGCFLPGRADGVGLAPAELRQWLRRDPQTLVWWSTLYRLRHASAVQHVGAECSACHVSAPRGLLYECLRCVSYTLCQACFLSGRSSADHDPCHPLQELCAPLTPAQRGREVLIRLGDKLRLAGAPKQRYLPLEATDHNDGDSTLQPVQDDQDLTVIMTGTNDALLSRTVLLDQALGGNAAEDCELRISPGPGEQGHERLPLETLPQVEGQLNSDCLSSEKQRAEQSKESYKQTPEEIRGKQPSLNNCGDDFLPPTNVAKKKKKGFMNLLFRGGKESKKDKKSKLGNKENIEMADGDNVSKLSFSRAASKSRSFGADGACRALPGDGGLRYGSCRMNQPWRRPPDAVCAPPPCAAAAPDASFLRVQFQNSSNSRHHQLLSAKDRAAASGGAVVERDTRQQLERVIAQLQYGYSALHDVSLSGPRTAAVVKDHTAQLLQQVAALKLLLQSLNGTVGVVPPRPRSVLPSRLLRAPSFESSTPIAGGAPRLAPSLAPQSTPLAAALPTLTKTALQHQLFRPPFRIPDSQSTKPRAAADGRDKECQERLREEGGGSLVGKGDTRRSESGVCWSSLSPITCNSQQSSRLLDDTAVLDNRQNHRVENPVFESEVTEGVFRVPAAPVAAFQQPRPDWTASQVASPASRSRLPSFTEVNFSDLTDASRARESRLADRYSEHCEQALASCGPQGANATFVGGDATLLEGGEDTHADTSCLELQMELEDILHQLDAMFPKATDKQDKECAGVVCAAQELGDCLAEYVNAVPPPSTAAAAAASGDQN